MIMTAHQRRDGPHDQSDDHHAKRGFQYDEVPGRIGSRCRLKDFKWSPVDAERLYFAVLDDGRHALDAILALPHEGRDFMPAVQRAARRLKFAHADQAIAKSLDLGFIQQGRDAQPARLVATARNVRSGHEPGVGLGARQARPIGARTRKIAIYKLAKKLTAHRVSFGVDTEAVERYK